MADGSQSTPPQKINIYNVASDDALWVLETDHEQLLHVLANPVAWVHANVEVGGEPAILSQPFVFVFHEVPPSVRTPSIHTEGIQTPMIHVQGIHNTSVVTVRYSRSTKPPSADKLFPDAEALAIIQVGQTVHTHLHLKGFSKMLVANHVFTSVSAPQVYIDAMNALPQSLNGQPTPPDKKLVFELPANKAVLVVYQGTADDVNNQITDESKCGDPQCTMASGDANTQGQVIVNGIVVKTYTL